LKHQRITCKVEQMYAEQRYGNKLSQLLVMADKCNSFILKKIFSKNIAVVRQQKMFTFSYQFFKRCKK